jgi:hypothetical protein
MVTDNSMPTLLSVVKGRRDDEEPAKGLPLRLLPGRGDTLAQP